MIQRIKDVLFIATVNLLVVAALFGAGEFYFRTFNPQGYGPSSYDVNAPLGIPYLERGNSMAYKGEAWVEDWYAERRKVDATGACGLRYVPFFLWSTEPCQSKYLNYGEDGFRVTDNVARGDATRSIRIFVFGGSTVAGDGLLRDADTIPSALARELSMQFPNVSFSVKNYGASGFNQDNSVVLLTTLLRRGEIPEVVVFYDGNNDVIGQIAADLPHMNYSAFQQIFNPPPPDTLPARIAKAIVARSHLVRWGLFLFKRGDVTTPELTYDPKVIADRAQRRATAMVGNYDFVQHLGKVYGFSVVAVLQPSLYTLARPSEEEKQVLAQNRRHADYVEITINAGYAALRQAVLNHGAVSEVFTDITNAFDEKDGAVYVDHIHVSPRGNRIVGRRLADLVSDRLGLRKP